MFRITGHKGFQMELPNGWTVSVQFGPGDYCSHRCRKYHHKDDRWESDTAEILAWKTDSQYDDPIADGDKLDVKGRCSPTKVVEFLSRVASFTDSPSKTTIQWPRHGKLAEKDKTVSNEHYEMAMDSLNSVPSNMLI